jgi:predicted urease superfamily metal-dependent hydrolase
MLKSIINYVYTIICDDDTHSILHPDQQSCTNYKVIATWSEENINWCNKGIVFGIEHHYNSRAECNKYMQQMYQMHMTLVERATKEMSRAWWTLKMNHETSW